MLKVDTHVEDGQDSHENADFILIVLNGSGEDAEIDIRLSSEPDFQPGKHPSSPPPAA